MTQRAWLVIVAAVAMACVTNPATGERQFNLLPEAQEIALGRESDAAVRAEMGVYQDDAWQAYVSRVGMAMAKQSHRPNLPWSFLVVDSPAINAFAIPGGFVYVTRGILPFLRSEAELANVLGHEIAHITALHGAEAYTRQQAFGVGLGVGRILAPDKYQGALSAAEVGMGLLFLKYGREAEMEADRFGVGYVAAGGWDPGGMVGLLGTLGRLSEASGSTRGVPNFLSTHPLAEDRIAAVQGEADAARGPSARTVNAAELSRRLPGLVWGDSREQGFVRGQQFLHPILKIALDFPAQWQIANGASQVVAQPADQTEAAMVLQAVSDATGGPAQVARTRMTAAGYTQTDGRDTTINGQRAHVGTYRGDGQMVQAAFIASGSQTYIVAGIATTGAFQGVRQRFDVSIGSFRPLSQAEADRLQPYRLGQYTVRAGDTWAAIANSASAGGDSASTLAIMNGMLPASTPTSGSRIRVITGG